MDNLNLDIDINYFAKMMFAEISSDLISLKCALQYSDSDKYLQSEYNLRQGFSWHTLPVQPKEYFRQREIHKCFKSIICSTIDYIDRLIATKTMLTKEIKTPREMSQEEFTSWFNANYRQTLIEVSTDRSLNNYKKLNIILGEDAVNNELGDSIKSFIDIRNVLEHHKGLPSHHRSIRLNRIAIFSKNNESEIQPFSLVSAGDSIYSKLVKDEFFFDSNGDVVLSIDQLERVATYIIEFVQPKIENALTTNK